jgi:olfactory receptor
MDDMLLNVMSYDQSVAMCHPLHYLIVINLQLCGLLALLSYLVSILGCPIHNVILLQFKYFKGVEISNFYCGSSQLLNLTCSAIISTNIGQYFLATVCGVFPISGEIIKLFPLL